MALKSFVVELAVGAALARLAIASGITSPPPFVQGYFPLSDGSWHTISCAGADSTYVTSGTYARCCTNPSFECNFVTSCSDNTMYSFGEQFLCPTGQACLSMTIYESATTDKPAIDYWCGESWIAPTIFRQTAPGATTTTGTPTDKTATPGSGTTAVAASATSTSTDSSDGASDGSDGGSKGWIAGAVIGPVAGCAIILALGYWIARRRLIKHQPLQSPTVVHPMYAPPYPGTGTPLMVSELSEGKPSGGPGGRPVELPGS